MKKNWLVLELLFPPNSNRKDWGITLASQGCCYEWKDFSSSHLQSFASCILEELNQFYCHMWPSSTGIYFVCRNLFTFFLDGCSSVDNIFQVLKHWLIVELKWHRSWHCVQKPWFYRGVCRLGNQLAETLLRTGNEEEVMGHDNNLLKVWSFREEQT